jgi:hypothetical protein
MQIIEKIGLKQFRVSWENITDSGLLLDFNPLISQFNLQGAFVLEHWQAKPKGLRRWGLYDSTSDNYFPCDYYQIKTGFNLDISSIQIDENLTEARPTAVKLYRNAKIEIRNGAFWITKILN